MLKVGLEVVNNGNIGIVVGMRMNAEIVNGAELYNISFDGEGSGYLYLENGAHLTNSELNVVKLKSELVIEVPVIFEKFITKDGQHTCSLSVTQNCRFLRSTIFGTRMVCLLDDYEESLNRTNIVGYLEPGQSCIFN